MSPRRTSDNMEARALLFRADLTDPRHGTANGYQNLRCKCDACTEANSRSHYEYMNDPEHPERREKHRQSVARARALSKLNHPSVQ